MSAKCSQKSSIADQVKKLSALWILAELWTAVFCVFASTGHTGLFLTYQAPFRGIAVVLLAFCLSKLVLLYLPKSVFAFGGSLHLVFSVTNPLDVLLRCVRQCLLK